MTLLSETRTSKLLDDTSPRTLQRWRQTGDGPPFVKIGGRVFYEESALEAFIQSRTFRSTAEAGATA